jgi:hypothetical protein
LEKLHHPSGDIGIPPEIGRMIMEHTDLPTYTRATRTSTYARNFYTDKMRNEKFLNLGGKQTGHLF